jgi:hypothetical protein
MTAFMISWLVVAAVLVGAAILIGSRTLKKGIGGILIDDRGRYSLTHFQVVLWSLVVLSAVGGLFIARLTAGIVDALNFDVPQELLIVMGISLGGAATATAIKAGKNETHPSRIAASNSDDRPRFAQIFLLEEGDLADQVVDVTKFQNFWLTLIVIGAFIALTYASNKGHEVAAITLPAFSGTLLTLLGISHAGYLAGKLPDQAGTPSGLSLALLRQQAKPLSPPAVVGTTPSLVAPSYVPRNPKRP